MLRTAIIKEVRSYVGTPYHHQGRLPGVGIDCVGLVVALCRKFQVPHEDATGYDRFGYGADVVEEFKKWLPVVPAGSVKPGDIPTFWVRRPGHVCHCGVYTPAGFVHTHEGVGRVVEQGLSKDWVSRIVTVFRLPGLEGE